jgi:hypothetical protein
MIYMNCDAFGEEEEENLKSRASVWVAQRLKLGINLQAKMELTSSFFLSQTQPYGK